jgi:hypothetical protein
MLTSDHINVKKPISFYVSYREIEKAFQQFSNENGLLVTTKYEFDDFKGLSEGEYLLYEPFVIPKNNVPLAAFDAPIWEANELTYVINCSSFDVFLPHSTPMFNKKVKMMVEFLAKDEPAVMLELVSTPESVGRRIMNPLKFSFDLRKVGASFLENCREVLAHYEIEGIKGEGNNIRIRYDHFYE